MTDARYLELSDPKGPDLTPAELARGWHFCRDWDGLLIGENLDALIHCNCGEPGDPIDQAKQRAIAFEKATGPSSDLIDF